MTGRAVRAFMRGGEVRRSVLFVIVGLLVAFSSFAVPTGSAASVIPCPHSAAGFPVVRSAAGSPPVPLNPCPGFEWAKTFGTVGQYDAAVGIDITSDGGSVVLVRTPLAGVTVVKLDAEGAVQWQKTIGSGWSANWGSVRQTSDSGFVVAAGSLTILVFRLDSAGDILWQTVFDGPGTEEVHSIEEISDGGFVVGGRTGKCGPTACDEDLFVIRLDPAGAVLWQKTYGQGAYNEVARAGVRPTSDGGFVAAGSTGGSNVWVIKLDASGNVAWQKKYEMSGSVFDAIQTTSDGGYVLAGAIAGKWAIVKLTASGAISWQKTYRGSLNPAGFPSIAEMGDGGFVSSMRVVTSRMYDVGVLRVDATGKALWQRTYGGASDDAPCYGPDCIQVAPDGNIVIAGWTNSFGTLGGSDSWFNTDAWVLRVFSDGSISSTCAPGFGTGYNVPTVFGAKLSVGVPSFTSSTYETATTDPGAAGSPGTLVSITQCSA